MRPAAQLPEASTSKIPHITSTPSSENKSKPNTSEIVVDSGSGTAQLPDDLAKQLAEDMEKLMRELSEGHNGPVPEEEKKRQEAWERMLIEGMNGLGVDDMLDRNSRDKSPESSSASQKKPVDDFQASILQAMDKLKESDSTLHVSCPSEWCCDVLLTFTRRMLRPQLLLQMTPLKLS